MKAKIYGWILILMLHVPLFLFGQNGKWSGAIGMQGYKLKRHSHPKSLTPWAIGY